MNAVRRKKLAEIMKKIEGLKSDLERLRDEEAYFPVSLEESERLEEMDDAVYNMEDAMNFLDDVMEKIEEAMA